MYVCMYEKMYVCMLLCKYEKILCMYVSVYVCM